MSGAAVEVVRSAVPVADLAVVDAALAGDGALADVLRKVRPADLGRDLSRRSGADVRRLLEASDDRRAASMLRVAHPAVAAKALASVESARAARVLGFMPTDHRARIVAALHDDARAGRRPTQATNGISDFVIRNERERAPRSSVESVHMRELQCLPRTEMRSWLRGRPRGWPN